MIPERSAVCATRRIGTSAKSNSRPIATERIAETPFNPRWPECWNSTNLAHRCGGTPTAFNAIGGANGT